MGVIEKVSDVFSDKDFALIWAFTDIKLEFFERYFTLYTHVSDEPIQIVKYFFSSLRPIRKQLCSDSFVVLTRNKLDRNLSKFFVEDHGLASKLFNNNGIMLRFGKLPKELQDEVALMINRYILWKVIDEINIRHRGQINQALSERMVSQIEPKSYSYRNLTNFIKKFVKVPKIQGIVLKVLKESFEITDDYSAKGYRTLCELPEFTLRFRLACEQQHSIEVQSRTQDLSRELVKSQTRKQEAPKVYSFFMDRLIEWYSERYYSRSQDGHDGWGCRGDLLMQIYKIWRDEPFKTLKIW